MKIILTIFSLLFPAKCIGCKSKKAENNKIFCDECFSEIEKSYAHNIRNVKYKQNFFYSNYYNKCVDDIVYPYFYKGKIFTNSIFVLKKFNKYYLFNFFADKMTEKIKNDKIFSNVKFDFITNVPRKRNSVNQYGYDQSQVLARYISKNLNIPYKKFLKRLNYGEEQKNLNLNERIENIKGKFLIRKNNVKILQHARILIIDDVLTSGATISECAKVLKTNGADKIYAAVIAKTL